MLADFYPCSLAALLFEGGNLALESAYDAANPSVVRAEPEVVRVDYSIIKNPPNIGAGKDFTLRQKQEALELNKAANGG